MREKVELLLAKGDFDALRESISPMKMDDIESLLLIIAHDESCISTYSFANYMRRITNSPEWHRVAISLMLHPFCFLEDAYSVALFHLREILKVRRTSSELYTLLFLYTVAGNVHAAEAHQVAEELLQEVPNDPVALRVLRETSAET